MIARSLFHFCTGDGLSRPLRRIVSDKQAEASLPPLSFCPLYLVLGPLVTLFGFLPRYAVCLAITLDEQLPVAEYLIVSAKFGG